MYRARLTNEEVEKFRADLKELEAGRDTRVDTVEDGPDHQIVSLTPRLEITAALLDDSFEEGLLNHWGWSDKFKKQ